MKRYSIVYKLTKESPEKSFKIFANSLGDAEYNAFDVLKVTGVYYLDGQLIKSYSSQHNRA